VLFWRPIAEEQDGAGGRILPEARLRRCKKRIVYAALQIQATRGRNGLLRCQTRCMPMGDAGQPGPRFLPTPVGLLPVDRPAVATARLVLAPIGQDQVADFLEGDFRSVRRGEGWPREKTEAGFPPWQLSLKLGAEVNWLVTLEGLTIGDCFTHGGADDSGDIEIGYGLAAAYRGNGYGTELVVGLAGWLILHPEINRVVARNVAADNTPSRRTLERAGFVLDDDHGVHVAYAFARG
jgi:RimJ/RimL family protein N-acetyltransferase